MDRLARSVPDERGITDSLRARGVKLTLVQSIYDPTSKMFFNRVAIFAKFEVDLIRRRIKEGITIARGKLKGKQPKLTDKQQKEL